MRRPKMAPERCAGSPPRPLRRPNPKRNLVDRLAQAIDQADGHGPDWPTVVEDAVLRQDMQWIEKAERVVQCRETAVATAVRTDFELGV